MPFTISKAPGISARSSSDSTDAEFRQQLSEAALHPSGSDAPHKRWGLLFVPFELHRGDDGGARNLARYAHR
jgi:hypothetical protein